MWLINLPSPSPLSDSIPPPPPHSSPTLYSLHRPQLESYSNQCSWFPPSGTESAFTDMILLDEQGSVTPSWTRHANPSPCNANTKVVSASEVDITYS